MRNLVSRKAINKEVQYNNRLTQFTNTPIQTYDLYVIRDLTVGGNTYMTNLSISGNFKVGGNSSLQKLDVSGNLVVAGNTCLQKLDVSGNFLVAGNTSLQKLDVSGNFLVAGNTSLQKLDVSGNVVVQNNILSYGSILASQFLPGQIVNMRMLNSVDIGQTSNINITAGNTGRVFTYTYTPKIANSFIVAEYQTIYALNGSNNDSIRANMYIINDSTNIGATFQQWINGAGGGTRSGTMFPIVGRYTNGDITSKDIYVNSTNYTDSDTIEIESSVSTWLKITEIAR